MIKPQWDKRRITLMPSPLARHSKKHIKNNWILISPTPCCFFFWWCYCPRWPTSTIYPNRSGFFGSKQQNDRAWSDRGEDLYLLRDQLRRSREKKTWMKNRSPFIHTPWRLRCNRRIHLWKRKIIFQTIIFRFYVNLLGCKSFGVVEQKRQFLLSNFLKSTTIHLGEGGIDCPDSTYIIYLSYIVYIISITINIYNYIYIQILQGPFRLVV